MVYDAVKIREVYHGLWKIEESFRIMKSDFDARPIYVNTREHVRAHFLICFTSLFIIRIMQHLRRKGYEVYVGKNENKEVDFVAMLRDERIYVQVCRRLLEESDWEVANLLEIKDHYPKYVITLDELAAGNVNGVKIMHLADFLLTESY